MCLYLGSAKQIATKEFKVYKVLRKNNRSLWMNYPYESNMLHPHVGLIVKMNETCDELCIEDGYHAYVSIEDAFENCPSKYYKVVEFTIPEGADYYLGLDGDIVSDQIVSGDLKSESKFLYFCKRVYNYVFTCYIRRIYGKGRY